jgi:roadblock/LC7 domain-containing protein
MPATKELENALAKAGTLAAGRFTADGRLVEYRANVEISQELAGMASQFAATVSMLLSTFSASYSVLSGIPLVPFHGWMYSGGDMTSMIEGGLWSIIRTEASPFRRAEPVREQTLHELLSLQGVKLAAYYAPDGGIIAYEQAMPLSHELRETATQIVASVVATSKGLAMAFSRLSQQPWTPYGVLIYSGGDWTIAASGTRWVLADAGECSVEEIYRALPW